MCGKKFKTRVYDDRHYSNGHYFGVMKLPVKGTGEYRKIGKSKLFDKELDVVEWTGEEKEIEYWECDSCFEEALNETWLEETIERLYGERCPDYEPGCPCCQAWSVHDTIIDANRGRL